jgi:RNA polymerase sigma factor (TIGR02999 family)
MPGPREPRKPPASPPGDVTRLLLAWSQGDSKALEVLIPLVYDELHRLAERHLARERAGHTLQPTAVVHEAYLKLVDQKRVSWKNRGHFFAVAAQAMRRLLVDHARRRDAAKRGGSVTLVPLEAADPADAPKVAPKEADVLALDRALEKLAALDATQAKVVELRYFGGLTLDETAEVLGSSASTVGRAFRLAKAWLYRELSAA